MSGELFFDWEKKDNQVLWISGWPGQGKALLMKAVAQEISSYTSNNAAAALRTFMWRVIDRRPSLATHLGDKRNTTGRTTFDDPNDFFALCRIFHGMIKDGKLLETYFILGNLHECSDEVGWPGIADLLKLIQSVKDFIKERVGALASAKGYEEELKNIIVASLCEMSTSNYLEFSFARL
ncbi:uncharacterized protein GGS25DRAFT_522885 [Hypoxylon fragiforme]|uniref:uncharacterized protein n=1 Tax=Hypoxylon fragiforme TaxID=63214 RepID=UPI0020C62DDA|nr:uncharacterized protein GGS25DRAFT_522885 [Hypoxylon fragiforme]KAI2607361.1 hypothetical protein GGS25DRAFT_522885 [Hypoxylon fragiforme]